MWLLTAGGGEAAAAASLGDATPYDGRSPREPSGAGTRVIVRLPRPSLGAAGIRDPAAQRTYEESLQDEAAALRSALGARGVRLSDVRTYTRTFNGFAATVRTGDLAELPSLGRARPARPPLLPRDRGARPRPRPARAGARAAARRRLDRRARHGRRPPTTRCSTAALDPGYDAVADDDDPARPRRSRSETSGTALAGVLVAAGERVLPIRIAGAQATGQGAGTEDVAVTDQLIAGLERAVDPDGDGATDDHAPVALIGVNSPYAGFERTPEAEAIRGAARLGTLVVAPAGGEGDAAGLGGVVGSPATAPDAIGAASLAAPAAVARLDLTVGGAEAEDALLLAGAPPRTDGLRTAGPVEADDAERARPRGPRPARRRPRRRHAGRPRRRGGRRRRPRGAARRPPPGPPAPGDPRRPRDRARAGRDRRGRRGRAGRGRRRGGDDRRRHAAARPAAPAARRCRRSRAAARPRPGARSPTSPRPARPRPRSPAAAARSPAAPRSRPRTPPSPPPSSSASGRAATARGAPARARLRRRARRRAARPAAPAPGASASPPASRASSRACRRPGGGDPCTVGGGVRARHAPQPGRAGPPTSGSTPSPTPARARELARAAAPDPARRRPRGRDRHHGGARTPASPPAGSSPAAR